MNEDKVLLQAKASTTQYDAVWANCEGVKVEKGKSIQENRGNAIARAAMLRHTPTFTNGLVGRQLAQLSVQL